VVADERGFRILLPGDPGYDEAVPSSGPAATSSAELGDIIRTIGSDGRGGSRP
jgi:hypothetical protein